MKNASPSHCSRSRAPGRPREFDMDAALDKAVKVFCERGYRTTSIGDLTEAMDLASGSVYKAFKDKMAIFLAAFDRYKTVKDQKLQDALATAETGRDKVRATLEFYAEASHGAEGRRGCLVVSSASELAVFDAGVAERVIAALQRNEALLAGLICQGQQDGSIPPQVDTGIAARLLPCLVQGMRVVGKTGRTRDEMVALAERAMKTLD